MQLAGQERVGGSDTGGEQGDEREGIGRDGEATHAGKEMMGKGGVVMAGISGDEEGKGDNIGVGHSVEQVVGVGEEAERGVGLEKVVGGKEKGRGREFELEEEGMESAKQREVTVAEGEAEKGDEMGKGGRGIRGLEVGNAYRGARKGEGERGRGDMAGGLEEGLGLGLGGGGGGGDKEEGGGMNGSASGSSGH